MKRILLFLLLLPFTAFGQKVIPMVEPMMSWSMAANSGTSGGGIGYFYAPDGWEIGNEIWTITDIVRDADSLDITVNDTAFYRLIGDSSQSFTDRTIVNTPSLLTNAPYGFAIHTDTTKTQSIIEDTDTLDWNVGGWLFEIKPPPPPPDALTTFTISAHERDTAITNAIGFDVTADSFRLNYVTGLTAPATRTANTIVLASSDTAAFKNLKVPIDVPDDNTNYAFALWSGRANSWTSNTDTVQLDSIGPTGSTLLDGLVSYWNCDEASGDAIDQVGSLDGTCTSIGYHASGKVSYGFSFNDIDNDKVTIGDHAELELAHLSVSGWIKTTGSWSPIISNYASGQGWGVYMISGNPGIEIGTTPTANAESNDDENDDTWVHVVTTYDGVTLKDYIDGVLQDDHPACSIVITYVGTTAYLGMMDGTSASPGTIDEIGVWNRALTQDEVTELYNSGTGITYPFE